jgi:hypothetical protein
MTVMKRLNSRQIEQYALTLAQMPEPVRESISSDEKLNFMAFTFFKLGFANGSVFGAEESRKLKDTI